ncbi:MULTISPECIES: glycosyltransferase family 2 protein [Phocaeicola]|uniref:glycosyltransferase family 2 protein n=1 Tax=Phocaeicola TaxID=909656 RepID=UPI0020307886|nr:glycosyltransferase family 2 protein [Phocaeicola massiliensis]MCM1613873.1 glycosyltransferase [Phocaeicola massiliensis]MCM1705860.1 glycosyltransferase [Phocaeicola massiliensis]
MKFDFSLLIPHKNSPDLLERLLKSVPPLNIQVIVVDDNSEPYNYKAVEELQSKFNFELRKNEGVYAGGARNTAMKYATGKWLIFADADDFFTSEFADRITYYKDTNFDIVFFNVTSIVSETGERAQRDSHTKYIAKQYKKTGDENYLRYCYTTPWGKMYKHGMIRKHGAKFEEVIAANDMMFAVKCGNAAERIAYDDHEVYCITVSRGSITTILNKEYFESKLNVTLRVNDFLREINKKKYRVSILYFLAKSYQFGLGYTLHVLHECLIHRTNFFIGARKILSYKKVLKGRQNPEHLIRK